MKEAELPILTWPENGRNQIGIVRLANRTIQTGNPDCGLAMNPNACLVSVRLPLDKYGLIRFNSISCRECQDECPFRNRSINNLYQGN